MIFYMKAHHKPERIVPIYGIVKVNANVFING